MARGEKFSGYIFRGERYFHFRSLVGGFLCYARRFAIQNRF
jgi:hypothetical protein